LSDYRPYPKSNGQWTVSLTADSGFGAAQVSAEVLEIIILQRVNQRKLPRQSFVTNLFMAELAKNASKKDEKDERP
jgi:hypothetical protein